MSARVLAALAVILGAAIPCAAQPAGERVNPFVMAGAMELEADIEACKIPATESQKEELRQAIRTMQQKVEMPDAAIAKIRQDMRADRSDKFWQDNAAEYCRDTKAKFTDHLAEVLRRSK